ncbi:UDP-glycosyltransferase [Flavobacterium sp. B11]|uniref:UDP-glycosyltransferase n=1 Tax=Flavobacterium movens TaxID=214860 RepID=UPI0031D7F428
MSKNKIFILLPDGIGLRNFAYSGFYNHASEQGLDVVFWNNTPFPVADLGFSEIPMKNAKINPWTDIYKNVKIQTEIKLNIKKTKDNVYNSYRFPFSYSTIKKTAKSLLVQTLSLFYFSDNGLLKIRKKMNKAERKTAYYQDCIETLEKEKPEFVFCTNQRPVLAIAPILAAQDLGIPTATFIFSWDNLPKATMVIETDYYFVWSDFMKKELLFYYPNIKEAQVFVTGTPQFESHFDKSKILSKEVFFEQYGLDINKKYICYSGDDVTTCPDDPKYLEDVAIAVRELNKKGDSLGIIFRRCPVDFSGRFDKVIDNYKDVIKAINPLWEKIKEEWNTILPTQEDVHLQMNTIAHTELVVNLGSSMIFDYASFKKPCVYLNYDVTNKIDKNWSVSKIYNFVHFRSMPNKKTVIWLNNAKEIEDKIKLGLQESFETVENAKNWFEIINQHPPEDSSKRICKTIQTILAN